MRKMSDRNEDVTSLQVVAMMQAAESRHGSDLAICTVMDFGSTTRRCFLRQRKMRTVLLVIVDVLAHPSF